MNESTYLGTIENTLAFNNYAYLCEKSQTSVADPDPAFHLMRIRILPFTLMRSGSVPILPDPDPTTHFFPFGTSNAPKWPSKASTFSLWCESGSRSNFPEWCGSESAKLSQTHVRIKSKGLCTYIFDVAPDGVSLGEAVELSERVDGAQPGVELTKLSRNHTNLFTPSMCVSGSVRIDIISFLPDPYPNPNVKLNYIL